MKMDRYARVSVIAVLCLVLGAVPYGIVSAAKEEPRRVADRQFGRKNYRDAARHYARAVAVAASREEKWHCARREIACYFRLGEFDEAEKRLLALPGLFKGTVYEARACVEAGKLFLQLPHWGYKSGGEFTRGRWKQGTYVVTYARDKRRAVRFLERARDLYTAYTAGKGPADALWKERIEALFDLAAALARFSPYDSRWSHTWFVWGEEEDGTVGEHDGRFIREGRFRSYNRIPRGLPADEKGNPVFTPVPASYAPDLHPEAKLKFVLHEIEKIDRTENQRYAARAIYRRAMLARARYGVDRLNRWGWLPYRGATLRAAVQRRKVWELKDNEVLTLVGGELAVVTLPPDEDIVSLLKTVASDYPRSGVADEALYAWGLYHQTRKQFAKALQVYGELKRTFPESRWVFKAAARMDDILRKEVKLEPTGVQLPGGLTRLKITYRNTGRVAFRAYRVDFLSYVKRGLERIRRKDKDWYYANPVDRLSAYFISGREPYKPYVKGLEAEWSTSVRDDGSHRYASAMVDTPLRRRGAYLVEALVDGRVLSRNVLLLQDTAVVEKKVKAGKLWYVCDARTGRPLPGMTLDVYVYAYRWNYRGPRNTLHVAWDTASLKTDKDGMCVFTPPVHLGYGGPRITVIAHDQDGRLAFLGSDWWRYRSPGVFTGVRCFVVTDRPVYRPLQAVHFKIWARRQVKGEYRPAREVRSLFVEVRDPKGKKILSRSFATDENGGVEGKILLPEGAPLGRYYISVKADGRWAQAGGNWFRVEEYKKPEFEVTVSAAGHVKLGEAFEAVVRARYYFGAPAAGARVTYKVFREEYTQRYVCPGEWDWLYGPGYGLYWYPCDWFPWWKRWGSRCWIGYPWWGCSSAAQRDLVLVGEGRLDENGELKIRIDTAEVKKRFGDTDHLYTVKAEVRDMSRRTVTGEGRVTVTRTAFRIFMEPERSYFRTGERVKVKVRVLTPDGKGCRTEGTVSAARILYTGENNSTVTEKPILRFSDATDERGELEISLRFDTAGQYRLEYATRDAWGGEVKGALALWVVGDDFDGAVYRFSDLEILTDKRTYRPGETAHLMLNTARAGAYVLFSADVENGVLLSHRLLHLEGKSRVVDVPVKRGGVPNFFVEALTVFDGKVHAETREICVPPVGGVMKVSVRPDRAEYRPGEKGTLLVKLTDREGRPVKGEVCLAVFDKSVLYIQPEVTPDIRKFFYGRKRYHRSWRRDNLGRRFYPRGDVRPPSGDKLWGDWLPEAWWGVWIDRYKDWRVFGFAKGEGGVAEAPGIPTQTAARLAVPTAERAEHVAQKAKRELEEKSMKNDNVGVGGGGPGEALLETPAVRKDFADTALWRGSVKTGGDGTARVEVTFPENLTTWKINCFGMTADTRVGSSSAAAVTTKKLILRLQAPRFFVERDEVVLSANIHNYLPSAKKVKAVVEVPADLMKLLSGKERVISVPPGGEKRVDWLVKVVREGRARITMKALTDEESDAVRMSFPVRVHGMEKTVAACGSIPAGEGTASGTIVLEVPRKRRPSLSRLEVRFSPSLAGAMVDAVPFLVSYPYGCTEQTISRFVSVVLARKTLQRMGLRFEDLRRIRTNLNPQERGDAAARRKRKYKGWGWADNPVFDSAEVDRIIRVGLTRIYNFQKPDGGWGWWAHDESSTYMTSYVLFGLLTARGADVAVDEGVIKRGLRFLAGRMIKDEAYFKKHTWKANPQAFACYVLAMGGKPAEKTMKILFKGRDYLSVYGKTLLALASFLSGDKARADVLLENVLQYVERDEENETAWLKTSTSGWWYWYNSDIESAAFLLKALAALRPRSPLVPRLTKWLLNNRRNGYYWRSTRDTTLCISAMADAAAASGEDKPDYTVSIEWDGKVYKRVRVEPGDIFSFDNGFVIAGDALTGGKHTLRIRREGKGAVYYSAYLDFFTLEDDIKGTGLEIKVHRRYYRLERVVKGVEVPDARGGTATEKRLRYRRVKLEKGARVKSGDILEVELLVESKNDYEYLAFEDMKPAGCEPVALRSGYTYGELCSNMELRDEKVVFFISWLRQGKHLLRYRLRAETPGLFHALPARGFAMYAPELRCNSDEMVLRIED